MTAQEVNIQIHRDVNKLIALVHELACSFPDHYRYSLGQEIHQNAFNLASLLLQIDESPKNAEFCYQFQDLVEVLQLEIALGHALNLINKDKNVELIELIAGIQKRVIC